MTDSEITQIKIGSHKVGFVGLKTALEDMAEQFENKPDNDVADELLKRLSKNNYIPDNVKETYGRAFTREFRRFLGQPFQDDDSSGVEIKVLGQGCPQCDRLEADVMDILEEINLSADLEHVRDIKEIAGYGVMGTPALIINGKVMCKGKVPSKGKLKKWLNQVKESLP